MNLQGIMLSEKKSNPKMLYMIPFLQHSLNDKIM